MSPTPFPDRRCSRLRRQMAVAFWLAAASVAWADGKVVAPRDYHGSLEERAQEAIIVFHASDEPGAATEELILKIQVEGDAREFAWIVPFPNEPETEKEDPKLFQELFKYVELRLSGSILNARTGSADAKPAAKAASEPVEVLSRKIVGDFDVAMVRENQQGGLNPWLQREGYQTLDDADDVLAFYREKKYVFACIKVSSEALVSERSIESHPLRFSFATGGRDGIYFPMRLTGLQSKPFDVNLYVFHRFWINDELSKYGYRHRGFELRYRDWDTPECVANGGKAYSLPDEDPFLRDVSHRLPTITKFFQTLHPGEKYYLTNIQARSLEPARVRQWPDDLWLFPYYTNRSMVPFDARAGGPAAATWPGVDDSPENPHLDNGSPVYLPMAAIFGGVGAMLAALASVAIVIWRRRQRTAPPPRQWKETI